MEKIYSKINGQLLHQIVRNSDIVSKRLDLSSEDWLKFYKSKDIS
jgi:hypothetical protein